MVVLQIEHKVQSFDGWKKAFDNDPIDRRNAGVRRYRVFQTKDDPNNVVIDLEFDNLADVEATLVKLHGLWSRVEGKIMVGAKTRILDIVEAKEY